MQFLLKLLKDFESWHVVCIFSLENNINNPDEQSVFGKSKQTILRLSNSSVRNFLK